MSNVHSNRIVEDRALNRVTSLFQEHGHIVHKIDGRNDFGEDLYISFVEQQQTTGDTIAVQVKGGKSYRAAQGYRVKVGQHGRSWLETNVPVICVIYDPDTTTLHWANASEQLRAAKTESIKVRSITVPSNAVLDEHSIDEAVGEMRRYIAERGEIRHALSKLVGRRFDTTDYVSYFLNELGEELVFRQQRGNSVATLLHSDFDWFPVEVVPDPLTGKQRAARLGVSTVQDLAERLDDPEIHEFVQQFGDMELGPILDMIPVIGGLIVNEDELTWLRCCVQASNWWRTAPA